MIQAGGQSIVDRFLAAKNTIAGQAVAKVVCKATTEEIMGPKRKHLDYLLQATHEMNVSIPEIADLLIERTQNSSWVVSFKALISIHHLMAFGNERFEAYMASHNNHLQSAIYVDRLGMPGGDMSTYIRRYSAYLNEKREAYKLLGYDFCKIKRGKEDGFLRTMTIDKLLKALPSICKQLDAILVFDISPNELTNGVVSSCFFLLIKDLIHLYAAFNDGVINLLEKYFELNKKQCREGLDIYKKFLERTEKVSQFLKIAESSGIERAEVPDLTQAPSSLLEALENHLTHIEGKKVSSQSLITRPQTDPDMRNFSRDLPVHASEDPQRILEEEAKALEQFNRKKDTTSPTLIATSNGNGFDGPVDLFAQKPASNGHHHLLTDDLFSLATPATQSNRNNYPASQNLFQSSAPPPPLSSSSSSSQNLFDDILLPTSSSQTSIPLVSNNPVMVTKPLQSGDLNSSLNQLINNLDIKDHSRVGKDHQWNPNEARNQQKIGLTAGTMNTPGTTWINPPTMSAPFGNTGIGLQSNPMWQPPPVSNPFAASNGSAQMTYGGMSNGSNPFAAQTSYMSQAQVNDPFGSL